MEGRGGEGRASPLRGMEVQGKDGSIAEVVYGGNGSDGGRLRGEGQGELTDACYPLRCSKSQDCMEVNNSVSRCACTFRNTLGVHTDLLLRVGDMIGNGEQISRGVWGHAKVHAPKLRVLAAPLPKQNPENGFQ